MTLFADLVSDSAQVARTSSRSAKVTILAELLARLDPGEIAVAVGFLSGVPRQGRVGVGRSTIYGLEVAVASQPSLTVLEVDRAIDETQEAIRSGSGARRREILGELFGRATEPE